MISAVDFHMKESILSMAWPIDSSDSWRTEAPALSEVGKSMTARDATSWITDVFSSTRTRILYIASVGLDHWLRFRCNRFDQFVKLQIVVESESRSGFGFGSGFGSEASLFWGWFESSEKTDLKKSIIVYSSYPFLTDVGFVFIVFVFGWQEKSVVGFVFTAFVLGWQGRSIAGFVFVFLGLWFLDFNLVFLDLGLCSCLRHT